MVFFDLVCPKCQESRYRSRMPLSPETKLSPELFTPLGDQPPAETYPEAALCCVCDSKLLPMPVGKAEKPSREEMAAKRLMAKAEYQEEMPVKGETSDSGHAAINTIFEVSEGEEHLDAQLLGEDKLLVKTNKRIVVINLKELANE